MCEPVETPLDHVAQLVEICVESGGLPPAEPSGFATGDLVATPGDGGLDLPGS
jgi:hypothetical protein